jgi:hypothetical protein
VTIDHPAAQPAPGTVSDGKIVVTPAKVRVGQKFKITCVDCPDPGPQDKLIIVNAGAPDDVVHDTPGAVVAYNAATTYYWQYGWEAGPYSPGNYEARWLTTLYNNEQRFEIGARGQFSIGR